MPRPISITLGKHIGPILYAINTKHTQNCAAAAVCMYTSVVNANTSFKFHITNIGTTNQHPTLNFNTNLYIYIYMDGFCDDDDERPQRFLSRNAIADRKWILWHHHRWTKLMVYMLYMHISMYGIVYIYMAPPSPTTFPPYGF